jgi:hypothetical protein
VAFANPHEPDEEVGRGLAAPGGEEDIRHDLVAWVRREIAAGTYDTEARWQAALDRLLARLATD